MTITYEDFKKLDLRVATILSIEKIPGKTRILKGQIDLGDEKSDSSSVPLLLRPKTFLEITNDGGIWIGDFFIAPYVSIGTIVAIPAGTIFSLLLKRAVEKRKKKS